MKTSNLAKTLLFVSGIFLGYSGHTGKALASDSPSGDGVAYPHFSCGTYRVQGYLNQNSQGDFILSGKKNTMSPFELILLGGSVPVKLQNLKHQVTVRVYVPRPIADPTRPFVFFQGIDPTHLEGEETHRLIQEEKCGDASRFQGS